MTMMNSLNLENFGVDELDKDALQLTTGGDNPALRKVAQWVVEQIGGWAIGEICSATWEAFKNSDHSMSSGQKAMHSAHQ